METPAVEQIRAWLVDLPMTRPFASARSALTARRIVVVSADCAGVTGWGEAAPVPGHTVEDADEVWTALRQLLATHSTLAPGRARGLLAAAFGQALDDVAAKAKDQPLWAALGGTAEVAASAAIGVDSDGRPDLAQVEAAVTSGYRNMKLKITPQSTVADLRQVVTAHPHVRFGADANASFGRSDRAHLEALDAVGLAYLEQPGSRYDLEFHCELRTHLQTPIALDESAADPAAITQIIDTGSADVITLKSGLLGSSRALQQAQTIAAAGIGVRLGGLIESGIGRAHTAALAGHPVITWPSDIAGSDRYFTEDLVRPQWRIRDGSIRIPDGAGIGVTVDRNALAAHALASLTAVVSG